jgi:hypothetical protein
MLMSGNYRPDPGVLAKPRLLIVSDSPDRLAGLRASLNTGEIEIITAQTLEEISRACRGGLDLVVVDVGAADIVEVLRTIRAQTECAGIAILVEASGLSVEPGLAGVLPKYRAMPCSSTELILLARRRLVPVTGRSQERKIL